MAELAFYVQAKYDEAIRLREELTNLRSAMMLVDESTEDGKKSMEELTKKYKETSIALNNVVDSAAEAALFMKQGASDTDKAVLDLIHSIKQGESSIQGIFSATREQMGAVVKDLDATKDVYTKLIDETQEKIKVLRDLRNQAFSNGNMSDGSAYNTQIDAMEREIREYERVIKAIDDKKKVADGEITQIEESIDAYNKQADALKETNDLTEEQARKLEKALGDALDLVLGKTQTFQETVRKVANVYKEAKELVDKYGGGTGKVAEAAQNAAKAHGILHTASLKLGTALLRMGVSASTARAALALIPGALGVAAISAAIAIITKLIRKHREVKEAAEEAKQKQMEYYDEIAKGAAPAIDKYEELRSKYVELRSEMEKKQFIDDNKKALDELGVSINTVNDADRFLIDGVEEYVAAQIKYAEADLKRAQAQEKIAKAASLRIQIEQADGSDETVTRSVNMSQYDYYKNVKGWDEGQLGELTNPDKMIAVKQEILLADDLRGQLQVLEGEIAETFKDIATTRKAGDRALQGIGDMGPQPLKYEDSIEGKTKALKKAWDDAKEKVRAMRADAAHFTADQLRAAEAEEARAKKDYEALAGKSSSGGGGKKRTDSDADKRTSAIEAYNKQIQAMIRSVEGDIAKTQIDAIGENSKRVKAQFDLEKQMLMDKAAEIGASMIDLFGANADLPGMFSGAESYKVKDKGGKVHELMITPVLPNGEVLSREEVQSYVGTVLGGSDDFLSADTKGLVVAVDIDKDAANKLREMQTVYQELTNLIEQYDDLKRQNYNKQSIKEITKKEWDEMMSAPEEQDDLDDLISQYGDYEQKRLQIHLKWLGKINAADEEHRALYERAFAQEMLTLDATASGVLAKVFGNVSKYTKAQLAEAKKIGTAYLDANKESMGPEQLEALMNAINAIDEAEIEKKFDVGEDNGPKLLQNIISINAYKKKNAELEAQGLEKSQEYEANQEKIAQLQDRISKDGWMTGIGTAINGLKKVSELMKRIADETGDTKLADTADFVSDLAGNLQAAQEGAKAWGGWWGAIIGGLTDIFNNVSEEVTEAGLEADKMQRLLTRSADLISNMTFSDRLKEDVQTIFGEDMNKEIENANRGLAEMGKKLKSYKNTSIQMTTSGSHKFLGIGKSSERKSLSQISSELGVGMYDELGNLDKNFLQLILNTYDSLTQKEREWIEQAIKDAEKYEQALDVLRDRLTSLFGGMADGLTEATIEGLKSGAVQGSFEMKRIMSGTAQDLQKQLVKGVYLRYLSKYEDEAFALMEKNAGEEDFLSLYSRMFDNMGDTITMAQNTALRFKELAESKGFEMGDLENATATAKAYQNITEQTGTAIDGRLTSLQLSSEVRNQWLSQVAFDVRLMAEAYSSHVNIADDCRDILSSMLLSVDAIKDNTDGVSGAIKDIQEKVENIEKTVRNTW